VKRDLFSILLSVLILSGYTAHAQWLTMYQTDTLVFDSEIIQESFKLDISKPKTWNYTTGEVAWPLIILFDSYNEVTHRHNLATADVLTFHSQIPESILVGVPFNQYNRFYLTSNTIKAGDSLAGIEKMEKFLFDELIPYCVKNFQTNGPVILLGHSRTGFLTSYLMVNRYRNFHMAGSFSSFLANRFETSDLITFLSERRSEYPFSYYFSAGSFTPEEEIYLTDLVQVRQILQSTPHDPAFQWHFMDHPYSGHMANYSRSVHVALTEYFGAFSKILSDWLFNKLSNDSLHQPVNVLKNDFETLATELGAPVSPQPVHFISIANSLQQNNRLADALSVLTYGMNLYGNDYDMNYYYIYCLAASGFTEKAEALIQQNMARIATDPNLDPHEQDMLQTDFRSIIQ